MRAIRSRPSCACVRTDLGTLTCLAVNSTSMVSLRSSFPGEKNHARKVRIVSHFALVGKRPPNPTVEEFYLFWPQAIEAMSFTDSQHDQDEDVQASGSRNGDPQ